MRHRHGGRWRLRARNWAALRRFGGWYDEKSVHEGGLVHLHAYWHGLLGVLGHRGHLRCSNAPLLRVSSELCDTDASTIVMEISWFRMWTSVPFPVNFRRGLEGKCQYLSMSVTKLLRCHVVLQVQE